MARLSSGYQVKDFLIYTNACSDGTDTMFDLLQSKGFVQHRENPFRKLKIKLPHAAFRPLPKNSWSNKQIG